MVVLFLPVVDCIHNHRSLRNLDPQNLPDDKGEEGIGTGVTDMESSSWVSVGAGAGAGAGVGTGTGTGTEAETDTEIETETEIEAES